jgi:hypothetical protein
MMVNPQDPPEKQVKALTTIIWVGLLGFLVLTVFIAIDLHDVETGEKGSVRIFAPAAYLYNHFGYWPAVTVTPILGAVVLPILVFRRRVLRRQIAAKAVDQPAPSPPPVQ